MSKYTAEWNWWNIMLVGILRVVSKLLLIAVHTDMEPENTYHGTKECVWNIEIYYDFYGLECLYRHGTHRTVKVHKLSYNGRVSLILIVSCQYIFLFDDPIGIRCFQTL